jgi:hypothetical protein
MLICRKNIHLMLLGSSQEENIFFTHSEENENVFHETEKFCRKLISFLIKNFEAKARTIFPSAWLQPSLRRNWIFKNISHPKCIFLPSLSFIRIFSLLICHQPQENYYRWNFSSPLPRVVYSLICIGIVVIHFDIHKLISVFFSHFFFRNGKLSLCIHRVFLPGNFMFEKL